MALSLPSPCASARLRRSFPRFDSGRKTERLCLAARFGESMTLLEHPGRTGRSAARSAVRLDTLITSAHRILRSWSHFLAPPSVHDLSLRVNAAVILRPRGHCLQNPTEIQQRAWLKFMSPKHQFLFRSRTLLFLK